MKLLCHQAPTQRKIANNSNFSNSTTHTEIQPWLLPHITKKIGCSKRPKGKMLFVMISSISLSKRFLASTFPASQFAKNNCRLIAGTEGHCFWCQANDSHDAKLFHYCFLCFGIWQIIGAYPILRLYVTLDFINPCCEAKLNSFLVKVWVDQAWFTTNSSSVLLNSSWIILLYFSLAGGVYAVYAWKRLSFLASCWFQFLAGKTLSSY